MSVHLMSPEESFDFPSFEFYVRSYVLLMLAMPINVGNGQVTQNDSKIAVFGSRSAWSFVFELGGNRYYTVHTTAGVAPSDCLPYNNVLDFS